MDDKLQDERKDDSELKRPAEEAIKDLEPKKDDGEGVTGGASDYYLKVGEVGGE